MDLLGDNHKKLGINIDAITSIRELRKTYHYFSHPGKIGFDMLRSFKNPGEIFLDGCFDPGKLKLYKIELDNRNYLTQKIPQVLDWVIENVETLE